MERPAQSEYGDYYHLYVSQVPEGDVFEILEGFAGGAQRDSCSLLSVSVP